MPFADVGTVQVSVCRTVSQMGEYKVKWSVYMYIYIYMLYHIIIHIYVISMNILSYNYHTVCESAAHDFFATVDIPGGLSPPF